jgi:flavin reductase (DIM6/NTAB) family NADH-FMN oxidoreductase RutF
MVDRGEQTQPVTRPGRGGPVTDRPPDQVELRDVFGMFATGITVLTAGQDSPHGMTANSFTSVSLEPPLVLVCVLRTARMHQAILDSGAFGVSMLAAGQEHIARYFASPTRPIGGGEFAMVDWAPGPHTGSPIVSDNIAWLDCSLTDVFDGGDHSIFLGRVLGLGRSRNSGALMFYRGSFHRLGMTG